MKPIGIVTSCLAVGLALFFAGRCSVERTAAPDEDAAIERSAQPQVWTCPMHPEVRLPEPGPCPKCGMDLVVTDGDAPQDSRVIEFSAAARELARIRTTEVERRFVTREVRMVGILDTDETRVRTITAWVPGRLERLYVDYAGVPVRRGDHLVSLYSPELSSAQAELLGAKARVGDTGVASSFLDESDLRAYESTREKLLQWGLTPAQLDEIEARGTAEDTIVLTSPVEGIVMQKLRDEGEYVETGSKIYTLADLSTLWVQLDAYEQDLPWLRYGQTVRVTAEALPGVEFDGGIVFIDPVIDMQRRTARVRLNIDNAQGELKPGMFVRGVVEARIGANGPLMEQSLAGKWISPMHPEIVKDGPGACDVCGMDLVPAEELGLVGVAGGEPPLVVPASALLLTGKRAVAYVELPDRNRPTFEGREVVLGPRAGDFYIVERGLEAGERVVTNGAFRIDSAMQIQARPSMLSMPGEQAPKSSASLEFEHSIAPWIAAYLDLQTALAADDFGAAHAAAEALHSAVTNVIWSAAPVSLRDSEAAATRRTETVHESPDLDSIRVEFELLSELVLTVVEAAGAPGGADLVRVHCPMAFEFTGADWLQSAGAVRNPYFGAAMLGCGSVEQTFEIR